MSFQFFSNVYLDDVIYFSNKIRVHYETSPQCPALQWLRPEQTAGKKHPYLFSQSQVSFFMTNVLLQTEKKKTKAKTINLIFYEKRGDKIQ